MRTSRWILSFTRHWSICQQHNSIAGRYTYSRSLAISCEIIKTKNPGTIANLFLPKTFHAAICQ